MKYSADNMAHLGRKYAQLYVKYLKLDSYLNNSSRKFNSNVYMKKWHERNKLFNELSDWDEYVCLNPAKFGNDKGVLPF